jgi:hypothetical protein
MAIGIRFAIWAPDDPPLSIGKSGERSDNSWRQVHKAPSSRFSHIRPQDRLAAGEINILPF